MKILNKRHELLHDIDELLSFYYAKFFHNQRFIVIYNTNTVFRDMVLTQLKEQVNAPDENANKKIS